MAVGAEAPGPELQLRGPLRGLWCRLWGVLAAVTLAWVGRVATSLGSEGAESRDGSWGLQGGEKKPVAGRGDWGAPYPCSLQPCGYSSPCTALSCNTGRGLGLSGGRVEFRANNSIGRFTKFSVCAGCLMDIISFSVHNLCAVEPYYCLFTHEETEAQGITVTQLLSGRDGI